MSLTTCAVSFRIFTDDGLPDAGATVSAILNQFEIYNGYVVPDLVSGTTDANGLAVLNLWPNELGSTASMYTIRIKSTNGKKLTTTAVVPNTASANIENIAEIPAYEGKNESQLALTAVIAASATAISAATAASNSATSASTSAETASTGATTATDQADIATTQATTATTQATAAENSATNAATSALNAANSESSAFTSATTATNKAAESSSAATSSATSASTATTKADEAANSAANAASSAAASQSSADSIIGSVTAATTQATNASNSAASAATFATTATNQASAASTSASNAALSAEAAASSAGAATSGGIRFDTGQSLTTGQKTQAQSNIGLTLGTTAQKWDADLDAIAALSGTAGLLKKTAANTWTLDTAAYLTGITSGQVTSALGYTPYNATNPASYTTLAAVAAVGYATGGGSATGTNTGDETNSTILSKIGTLTAAKGGTGLTSPGTSGYVLTSTGTGFVMSPAAGGGATGGGTDAIFVQNGQTVTTSYTLPAGQNASSVGLITVASGAVVTISAGSTWAII